MKTRVLGHRGASFYAPENTIPAFELALEQGADGIELDVHLSKDGELIVIHDERVDRTTNGKGFIKDLTLEELKSLDASYDKAEYAGAVIPTLAEVYSLFRENDKIVNVEIKTDIFDYPGICEKLLELEKSAGMQGRVIYSSFNHYTVREMKALAPEEKIGLLYMSGLYAPWEYAKTVGAECLHPYFLSVSRNPRMVEECTKLGIETNLWTVNESVWMERFKKLGVTSLITDKPDLARTIIS